MSQEIEEMRAGWCRCPRCVVRIASWKPGDCDDERLPWACDVCGAMGHKAVGPEGYCEAHEPEDWKDDDAPAGQTNRASVVQRGERLFVGVDHGAGPDRVVTTIVKVGDDGSPVRIMSERADLERVEDDGDVIVAESCGERATVQEAGGMVLPTVTHYPAGSSTLVLTPQQARALLLALTAWGER